jgi:hypothetical protein
MATNTPLNTDAIATELEAKLALGQIDLSKTFDYFRFAENREIQVKAKWFCLFTTPNIYIGKDSDFYKYNAYASNLPDSFLNMFANSNFLLPLSNLADGFNPSDVTADSISYGENLISLKQVFNGNHFGSISGGSFNIEFNETANSLITWIIKVWFDYMSQVRTGAIRRNPEKTLHSLTDLKQVDYLSSMFYLLVKEDGEIIYYNKLTGICPTAIPYSSYSSDGQSGSPIKLSVPFSYHIKEDLEIEILGDINYIASGKYTASNETPSLSMLKQWYNAIITDSETTELNKNALAINLKDIDKSKTQFWIDTEPYTLNNQGLSADKSFNPTMKTKFYLRTASEAKFFDSYLKKGK